MVVTCQEKQQQQLEHLNYIIEEVLEKGKDSNIAKALRECNQKYFGQVAGNFPTTLPFSEKVDWVSLTHYVDMILEGSYSDAEISDIAKEFLQWMKKKTELDATPA